MSITNITTRHTAACFVEKLMHMFTCYSSSFPLLPRQSYVLFVSRVFRTQPSKPHVLLLLLFGWNWCPVPCEQISRGTVLLPSSFAGVIASIRPLVM